jgi:hypothetical protein
LSALCAECLLYAFRAWHLVLGLGIGLAALTVGAVLLLPKALELWTEPASLAFLSGLLLPLTIAGYATGLLDGALTSGILAEDRHVWWPGPYIVMALKSAVTWLICFLAGPVVPAVIGFFYWLQCGDPTPLDWLILTELGIVCVSYWTFTLLSVSQRGNLLDANPVAVAALVHRLGIASIVVVFTCAVVALIHGRLLFHVVTDLRQDIGGGTLLLIACWTSWLGWGTFFLRLLGRYCRLPDARLTSASFRRSYPRARARSSAR